MKSAVETLTPTRVKLTVEVEYPELEPSIKAAYTTIGAQVQVPGFRKGKVPPRVIDQRVGRAAVLQEAINEALPGFYSRAVEETEIRPLGQPEVDVTSVPDPKDGGDLTFTAEIDVRPTLELPDYAGLEITVDDVLVTDADVDVSLEALRARFGTLTGVDRPAVNGDFVSLDIAATLGEEEIDSVKGVSYEVGTGTMLPGLDDAVTDLSAGETTTFVSALAGGEHAGEEAQVTVTVSQVKERVLPALDDDFATLASEFDTLTELRDDLRDKAAQGKRFEQGIQARDRVLDRLLELVEVPVPENLVDAEVERHLEGEDRAGDDEHRAEVQTQTRSAMRSQFLLDAIAEKEAVRVEQQDLIEWVVANSQRYRMEPQALAQALESSGQLPSTIADVARRKALAAVLERAVVTDASGNLVDMESLVPRRDEDDDDDVAAEDDTADSVGAVQVGRYDPSDPASVRL